MKLCYKISLCYIFQIKRIYCPWCPHRVAQKSTILKSLPSVISGLLKGNPQFCGAFLAQGHAHFSSACDFMMGLAKPNLHTKFEVASCSRCRIVKGNPNILGSSPSTWPRPLFLLGGISWIALANLACLPILKSLPSVVAEMLKRNPNIWELF